MARGRTYSSSDVPNTGGSVDYVGGTKAGGAQRIRAHSISGGDPRESKIAGSGGTLTDAAEVGVGVGVGKRLFGGDFDGVDDIVENRSPREIDVFDLEMDADDDVGMDGGDDGDDDEDDGEQEQDQDMPFAWRESESISTVPPVSAGEGAGAEVGMTEAFSSSYRTHLKSYADADGTIPVVTLGAVVHNAVQKSSESLFQQCAAPQPLVSFSNALPASGEVHQGC